MVQLLQLLEIAPETIIPQRPPFIMIDHLTGYDERTNSTCLTVRPDNIFVAEGRMLATGIVEHIAQTCAARLGYYNLISGLPVKIGYIGAVNNMHVVRCPMVGEKIETTICVQEEVFGMTLVHAEVRVADELIASADMKIAIQ
jgi:predicted hotdog family 3-hydroxylacyl-ACP dehydratase